MAKRAIQLHNKDMEKYRLSAMLFFVISTLLFLHYASGADPLDTYCPNGFTNYTLTSPFYNNLKLLLGSLSSNTSVTGFYNTSIGEDPDKVHGQALCRGDASAAICQSCIGNASQDILRRCKSEDSMIWYELCQVRYSYQMFFSTYAYTGKYPEQNIQEKNVSDPIQFNEMLMYLMRKLSDEAAFNHSRNKFTTGEIKFSGNKKIYGLVQCTRDMSETYCFNCLSSAVADLRACCSYREGGIILSRTCNVRFELSQFFNTSYYQLNYATSKAGGKWKLWVILLITCASVIVLAIVVGACAVYIRRKQGRDRDEEKNEKTLLQELASPKGVTVTEDGELVSSEELVFMNLETIREATDDFSDRNKLGQGSFGAVYKGVLPDGNEVAIKRLSRKSWQGIEEFKNELILIAKLQHKNLVRLLGCGLEGDEKLLIYEFMSNKSLDEFIFDAKRRLELDWKTYHGREIEFVDATLLEACPASEVINWMHVGLLCVQQDPGDRPSMSDVVVHLGSESMELPKPKQPAFSLRKAVPVDPSSLTDSSANKLLASSSVLAR
ncbi:hypothetical protein L6164_035836 [Bauhinia variegata]|uniref:Uncharacterized protein n=1 Tax=Bauhinia variegata TaxID=167791 RepID=A0ACB9KFB0_BAUVA|nr:hypothetical protein L6164_035836 [Bauhinia variegata]